MRPYPKIGRNLVLDGERLTDGPGKALVQAARLARGFYRGVLRVSRGGSPKSEFLNFVRTLGGVVSIGAVHLVPKRIRRVVLWEQPNIGELCMGADYLLRWLHNQPERSASEYTLITSRSHNRTLAKMVNRSVRVLESPLLYDWFRPAFNTSRVASFQGYFGPMGDFEDLAPPFSFSDEERRTGEDLLREMGLASDSPFVCMHWRDAAFSNTRSHGSSEAFSTCRNTAMENMLPAMRHVANEGFSVLRMGSLVERALPESFAHECPRVIDYARAHRSDLGDIFLPAYCRLFIGTNSGLIAVPQAFNRPMVLVDYVMPQWLNHYSSRVLVIFKTYRRKGNGAPVGYREMLERFPWYWNDRTLDGAGIEVVPNTAEEILSAVQEGLELLNAVDQATKEDRALQLRFRSIFAPQSADHHRLPRVGREFLRRYAHLLD